MDDASLVAEFVARRPRGLAVAYERYAPELLAVARHVLGVAEAEDCVHETLMRVWRAPGSFRVERGSLRAFLIACVRNEAVSSLRSGKRRQERELRAVRLELEREIVEPPLDALEAVRVRAALGRLPSEQRTVIELAYYRNQTQTKIAEELGLPLGTVKSRVALALRRLARELETVAR